MHHLRCLVFIEAAHQGFLHPIYTDTKYNHLVDISSHKNLSSLLHKFPKANSHATPVSQPLLNRLLDPKADWISPTWSHHFSSIFRTV